MFLKKIFNKKKLIENRNVYIILLIIGFLTYSYTFYHFNYNQDGIGRVFREMMSFEESIRNGRWSYFIFFNLFNHTIHIPILIGVIVILINCLTTTIIYEIFNIKDLSKKIFIGSLYMTFPGYIYYFYYTGDIEVYISAIFSLTLSIYLFTLHKKWIYLSIILAVIGLASYPALFAYFTTLALLNVIYNYTKKTQPLRQNFIFLSKTIVYILVSLFIFFASSKLLLYIYDIEMSNYKSAAEINITELLLRFPYKLIWVFLLFARYLLNVSFMIKILLVINLLSITYILNKRSKSFMEYLYSSLLLFLIIPFIFSIYLITYEIWPYAGFEFGFLCFLSIPFLFFIKERISNLFSIIYILIIFSNIQTINKIALEHQLNNEASKHIISNMIYEMQKHREYKNTTPIVIVGDIRNNDNYKFADIIPNSMLYNAMEIPAGFSGDVSTKIKNQATLLNIDLNVVDNSFSKYIPEQQFPKEGSISVVNDTLYINIGANKEAKNRKAVRGKDNIIEIEEGSLKSNPVAKYLLERL